MNDLHYYRSIFWLRLPLFLLVAGLVLTLAVFVASKLPTTYQSSADLLLEGSQIPVELAASTVRIDMVEQLQVIQQRTLTRQNLLNMADRLELYVDAPDLNPDQIVQQMRDRITMRIRSGRSQATLFSVVATAESGLVASRMANDLVSQILESDAIFRSEIAAETLKFFEDEVQRLGEELDIISGRILEFQNANGDALPETLSYRLNRQTLLQERLAQNRRDIAEFRDQRRKLTEAFESTGSTAQVTGLARSPQELELQAARAELSRARAIFSESNPQVRLLLARVTQLEQTIAAQAGPPAQDNDEPIVTVLDVQLKDLDARIESAMRRASEIEVDLEELQETIDRTPANAIALSGLQRDHLNVQAQYNSAVDRLSTAAIGERIELLSKGQRLVIIEQPTVPNSPSSPNRPLIIAASAIFGSALGLAAIILAELMRGYVRRPVEVTRALGITPLATLPYVETVSEQVGRAAIRAIVIIGILIGIPAGLWLIDTQVMPLEAIVDRVRTRLGL